jgi:EAL domain-containing protein (putative c-di-GMP-specific phosphodiesterase class I)
VVGLPDPADAAVVRLIVGMAEVLDVAVVAEGIETPQHLEILLAAGCRQGQGYLFARPSSSEEAGRMLTYGVPARGVGVTT